MIHSIKADNPAFKKINFRDGFNVVLAAEPKNPPKKIPEMVWGNPHLLKLFSFAWVE